MSVLYRLTAGVVLAASLMLAGCGSESDRIDVDLDGSGENAVAGIYRVTLSSTTGNSRDEDWLFLLAAPQSTVEPVARIAGYDRDDPQRIMVGQYRQGVGQTLTGALRFYDIVTEEIEEPSEDPDVDEPVITEIQVRRTRSLTLSGVFDPRNTLDATFTGQSEEGDSVGDGRIYGEYQERAYERLSSVAAITGDWRRQDEFGFDAVTFNYGGDTGVFGLAPDPVSGSQCRYDGRFSLINARFNIYAISMDQSGCGTTDTPGGTPPLRTMQGLATLQDIPVGGDPEDAREMLMIMGSAPSLDDGLAEGRVFRLERRTGP